MFFMLSARLESPPQSTHLSKTILRPISSQSLSCPLPSCFLSSKTIHTYGMSYNVFLPKVVELTMRKLCPASSFLLCFSLFVLTCEHTVSHQDGNIDFSRQTVNITFWEKLLIPSYKGHVDLHLGCWTPRFAHNHWGFLWGEPPSPAIPQDAPGRVWLWLRPSSPALTLSQKFHKLLDIKPFFHLHSSL